MNTKASEIIDALGGTMAVAAIAQVVKSAVANWRVRGIPPMTYRYIMAAHKRKLTGIADPHLSQSRVK